MAFFARHPFDFNPFGELHLSPQTAEAYKKRAHWLHQLYQRENPNRQPENFKGMVVWLLRKREKNDLSVNTFLQYKNALVYWLWHENNSNPIARQAAVFLAQQSSFGTNSNGTQTSSKKQKFIRPEELSILVAYFDTQSNGNTENWYYRTKLFLISGILTGMRLVEWQTAKLIIDNDCAMIEVQNGKASNGRSNGKQRHIVLSAVNELELAIIAEHIEQISNTRDFEYYKKQCNHYLKKAQKACNMNGNISLSSCRHQFAANGKKALTESELSALMGHGFTRTAQQRYGHIRYSWGSDNSKVKPLSSEVATVKKNHKPIPADILTPAAKQSTDYAPNVDLPKK